MIDLSIIPESTFLRVDLKKRDIKDPEHADAASTHRRVAKEMESLFAYQLLKITGETVNNICGTKIKTSDVTPIRVYYGKVSRLLSERGPGLQDSIEKCLARKPESIQSKTDDDKYVQKRNKRINM